MINQTLFHTYADSPVGPLKIVATEEHICAIKFSEEERQSNSQSKGNELLKKAEEQLSRYFKGEQKTFDLPLLAQGTEFEREVWKQLSTVKYGRTVTYSQIAKRLGDVNKVRAVGRANGQNPIPIIIPCHRVIGAGNKLTGYAGGIERKRWLLQHEGALLL